MGDLVTDQGMRAVLDRSAAWPPPAGPFGRETIHWWRANQSREVAFQQPYQEVADVTDHVADGRDGPVRVRAYAPHGLAPSAPALVRIHGGGMVLGSPEFEERDSRAFANRLGCRVFAPSYRLAPEHPFPAGLDDCVATIRWVHDQAQALGVDRSRIVVFGHSAGALLALSCALELATTPLRVARYVALEPTTEPGADEASMRTFATGYQLTAEAIDVCWELYLAGQPATARSAPALATDAQLQGLDPVTIATAELDPLRDEGEAFAARLREAGVDVRHHRLDGLLHGSIGYAGISAPAARAFDLLVDEVRAAFESEIAAQPVSASG